MSMRPSPKLRPTVWDALLAAAILALAALCALSVRGQGTGEALTAVVSIDGREAERVDLTAAAPDTERTYTGSGYTLTVDFCPGGETGVRVAHADCPNRDCVRTGLITRSGESIVCLPGRIVIRLESGGSDGVDAVLG